MKELERQRSNSTKDWRFSPLFVWVCENGSIVLLSLLVYAAEAEKPLEVPFWELFLRTLIGSLISVDGAIFIQGLFLFFLFSDIPYYNQEKREAAERREKRKRSVWEEWRSLWTVLWPAKCVGSFLIALWTSTIHPDEMEIRTKTFAYGFFLPKLLFIRIFSDITFYIAHLLLHAHPAIYSFVHKRHHEDVYTSLSSNVHFTLTDLVVEGFVPIYLSMILLDLVRNLSGCDQLLVTNADLRLFMIYIQWYQIGSHVGKDVPFVTFFPPLAPLYRLFFPNLDRDNILFHETHHNVLKCNYGITQWMDQLFNTRIVPSLPPSS